ncbi:unnamed protein product [Brassica rapa subsp. narinosa]
MENQYKNYRGKIRVWERRLEVLDFHLRRTQAIHHIRYHRNFSKPALLCPSD